MDGRGAPMGRRDVLGAGAGMLAAGLVAGCARGDGSGR
ncbi:polysaccharide deacetylase family protein, partial [Streptomyces griseus]|nr:polysaccharide deacetylase family protein [Streptomyces griseus]